MRKLVLASLILLSGCATKSRQPSSVVSLPSNAWELEQALSQGTVPTLDYLKTHITATPYGGLNGRDPSAQLPKEIRAEKGAPVSKEKNQQSAFIRKFRGWTPEHRVKHGDELVANFSCEHALETQSMGYILEIDFPEQKAKELSASLHDKVLTCPEFAKQESVFRLAVFSIQAGDCTKALDYLNKYPASPERGSQDRSTYLKSFCSPSVAGEIRNPLGGYGILLTDHEKKDTKTPWLLGVSSGDESWDRLLATFAQLTEKNKSETVQYLASKINYEKLRALPISFQTSMLVLMSFNGADLSVFQTLHKYLADHPETMTPSVSALLFPVRYWKEIVDNTSKADPVLVKALIRQESAFNKAARSRAKAAGLMQLIYPTAKRYGIREPRQLLSPEKNIHAGSEFLAGLIEDFGSVELALAAYNAGPAIVRQWQKRYPTDNVDLFVEMIPYTETREYVRLVKRNYKVYQSILVKPQVLGSTKP